MEYCAMANIGVQGYGRVTPGEFLDEKCKEILGEDILAELVERGALRAELYEYPKAEMNEAANADTPELEAPKEIAGAPEEPGDEEEGDEELEPDTMDDVVDEEAEPAPNPKPKKNSGGRKAK